jgi:hypothetical protein
LDYHLLFAKPCLSQEIVEILPIEQKIKQLYMKPQPSLLPILFVIMLTSFSFKAQSNPTMGYTQESSSKQLALQAQMDQMVNANNLDNWMQYMSDKTPKSDVHKVYGITTFELG